jgi:actin-related protein
MKLSLQLLLIALCGVGIYFSVDAKSKFQAQADAVVKVTADNKTLDENITKRETELDVQKKGFAAADEDYINKESELGIAKNKARQIATEIASYDSDLESQQQELDKQQKLLKETKAAVAEALEKDPEEISVDTIAGDIESLKNNEKDQQTKLDDLNLLIEKAEGAIAKNKTSIADLESRKSRRDERIRSNSIEAVVSAVDTDWGICTINAGANLGFTPQSRLIVTRRNAHIGNVSPEKITEKETVAKINFESFAPGVMIQPGDRVMLEKPLND